MEGRNVPDGAIARVCLVTEELSSGRGAGGIGGAFHELALALRRAGHAVEVIYLPVDLPEASPEPLVTYYADHGVRIVTLDMDSYVWGPYSYEKRSYAVFRHLVALDEPYDFVHFHDYKGLGFFTLAAKSQRLGFASTTLVVQLHGPTRWTLQANDHPFTDEAQLQIDFMERESIARADLLVSPSQYMLKWLKQQDWKIPPTDRVHVIQNICTHLVTMLGPCGPRSAPTACNEIVFFGRHEERKGIVEFCDALDLIADELAQANILATWLGKFGLVGGEPSALYLARRACDWRFPIRLLPDCDRTAACGVIAGNERSVVVIPSRFENSPYTVMEAAIAGKPLITSSAGGAVELLEPTQVTALTCQMDRQALAERLLTAIRSGLPAARLATAPEKTEQQWIDLHTRPRTTARKLAASAQPKVVAAITHHDRPAKLYDAILSLASQLYPNLEIVIVDDGSDQATSLEFLDRLQPLLEKLKIRLLRQPNRYLGAARNHAIAQTESEYIIFLDDDDIAFPNLVQTLVTAAEATAADIVNCLPLYMAEQRRNEAYPFPDQFAEKASYVPTGGPLSLAPLDNCFGMSTSLLRRSALTKLGGYTEDYGIGHEDFELYVRALQMGLRIEVCPLPLMLYEVDRPSMLTATSRLRNWNRVVRTIDPSRHPSAWHDLASLTAGRRAMEHVFNYRQWHIAHDPQADLLKKIVEMPTDEAKYPSLVQQHAERLGAGSYARALSTLAATRATHAADAAVLMPPLTPHISEVNNHRNPADPLLLGAMIDVSLDRMEQAIAAYQLSRERTPGPLSEGQLQLLRAFAKHDRLTSDDAHRLLASLKRQSSTLDELRKLTPVMFRLALCSHDIQAAIDLIDRAMVVDEQCYLNDHPDAAQLISDGELTSAMDHFVRAMETPDPRDFALLRGLKVALQAKLGVELPITSLRAYMLSLAQGQVARRDLPQTGRRLNGGNGVYRRQNGKSPNTEHAPS